jgi:hypothetical protein
MDWKSKRQREKEKYKSRFIWSIESLNRSWPFIFIGWGSLAPQGNPSTSLNLSGLLFSVRTGGTGQTGVLGVQILYKSFLPRPDSDLDVPHMNLDLLDETYPMVKSKLYFIIFDYTSLTGGTHRSDRSDKTCQFWVRTYAPCFLVKLACQKTFTKIKIG